MVSTRLNHSGFTLIEIIAVLIILSVMASLAIPRYINLEAGGKMRALDAGIAELNGRESLTWSNVKISHTGWEDDETLYTLISGNLDLEGKYVWEDGPTRAGGSLRFDDSPVVVLTRNESTQDSPATWTK
jgi:prepilin-type N-terminal cleavage/methylation domain-containing protein